LDEKEREQESKEDLIRSHLEPLALPNTTVLEILVTLRNRPDGLGRTARRLEQYNAAAEQTSEQLPTWPVASGLSISLGYVIGGIIPLFPYFFTPTVGNGLQWSIALCLIALMAFGSGKSWVLRGEERSIKRSLWEGLQMLILGSLAAGAAVLCVNLLGAGSEAGN
jgi:VIT1/CCC1 family predicted Fe2+/Mn2+ transporter